LLLACGAEGATEPDGSHLSGRAALWLLPSQQCVPQDPTNCVQIGSYVLQTQHLQLIVIDGGSAHDAAYLRSFIRARSPDSPRVHAWFVSHTHSDHVGALTKILQDNRNPVDAVRIDEIYGSILPLDTIAKYARGEFGQQEILTWQAFHSALAGAGARVAEVDTGQIIRVDNVEIEVLGRKNPELSTRNLVNNSSVVMRVWDGTKSILFTGDLGLDAGQKLLRTRFAERLPSDFVEMSHHGQLGVDRSFYERVRPKYALWPTSRAIWSWASTQEVYGWMTELGVERHFRQFDGLIGIDTGDPASQGWGPAAHPPDTSVVGPLGRLSSDRPASAPRRSPGSG
jgi:hypothetical protein